MRVQSSVALTSLTSIWERVLQKAPIGIEDNFFRLGGNLRSADLLSAEIGRELGRELPSATIYHAQTIAALACLLEKPALPQFSPLVQVKRGDDHPPILIMHGLAGTVPFFELAAHIRTENPVYGFQAKGVDGMEEPLDRVEDMAALYLDSVKALQPCSPYILVGYSFGGLVALEMAQRLIESGETVALLAIVDAYPDIRYLSSGQRALLFARRARRYIFDSKNRLSRAMRYIGPGLGIAERRNGEGGAESSGLSFAETTLRVKERAYVALARYRPRYYPGKMTFLKSGSDTYFPGNPTAVWAHLTAEFEFETVPGGHLGLITTDFESLAAVLTRYLKTEPGRQQG